MQKLTEEELLKYGIVTINEKYIHYGKILPAKEIFALEPENGIYSLVNEEENFLFGFGSKR